MAVPFTRLLSQVLDNHNLKLHDALRRFDGIVGVLGMKGKIQFETGGGEDFKERILYGENTNAAFRGKNDQIPTNDDEGITMAEVPQRVFSMSLVINQVERDQVAEGSRWAIGNLVQDKTKQARSTYIRIWADKLRQATPGASDPFTLLPSGTSGTINGILSPVAPASAAGTTAGISRADNSWWRNQYTNTSIDISAEAGRASLYNLSYALCVRGNSKEDEPDFGIVGTAVLGDLVAAADTLRRGTFTDQAMVKAGFENYMFYNAALIRDSSTRFTGKCAFITTRDLGIKVLRSQAGKYTKEMFDEENNLGSIPIFMSPFKQDIDTLNDVSTGYCVASLVPSLLDTHGLADNII